MKRLKESAEVTSESADDPVANAVEYLREMRDSATSPERFRWLVATLTDLAAKMSEHQRADVVAQAYAERLAWPARANN